MSLVPFHINKSRLYISQLDINNGMVMSLSGLILNVFQIAATIKKENGKMETFFTQGFLFCPVMSYKTSIRQ